MELGWCSGWQSVSEARLETLYLMQCEVLMLLVTIVRGLGWIDRPFQAPNCFLDQFARRIRAATFDHCLQHVAHSGTMVGQFYKGIVVCHLVLGASSRGIREKGQKETRTLTRPKISITNPNATFKGAISMLLLAAVRVSISVFNAAVVVE